VRISFLFFFAVSVITGIGIIALGTCGYYFVEHMPLFEAFYMTIITISTVGFAEVVPLSQAGRAITVIIIILGISVGAYTIGVLVKAIKKSFYHLRFRAHRPHCL
jgi:voltage-gated potassium channel